MSFPTPTLEQIREAILRDQRNLDPDIDVTTDSDTYVRASGDASAIQGLYEYMSWGVNQFFPDTADLENLVRHASSRGILQIPATSAVGTITLTGAAGATVPIGTVAQVDGAQYQTTADGEIDIGGVASIAARALIAGIGGNLPNNTAGTLMSAPAGVDADVFFVEMGGGVETESTASLLARALDRLRKPPAGGNKFDYVRWAKEVAGVTEAYCFPKRRGGGTVDTAVLSNGAPATEALRNAVSAHFDNLAPANADFMALSPQLVLVDIDVTLVLAAGYSFASVQAIAETAIAAYFATLKPGDTAVRSRIQTIIGGIAGVADYIITAPAANVDTLVDASHVEMPALGAVAIGL